MDALRAHTTDSKTELFLKALLGSAVEAQCVKCQAVEQIIPIEDPIDSVFLANYHCDGCDSNC